MKRLVKSLIAHGKHIEKYLSTYFSPNTHLTGEALGLLYLGLALPECTRAAAWKQKGLGVLLEQMPKQIRSDGVYFEQSSYYHRYTVDIYLNLFQLARENNITLPPEVELRLAAMIDYLMWITRPDGTHTLVGDDDGGKLIVLGTRDTYDFKDSLAVGAALLGRPDWKYAAGAEHPELLWLLGRDGLDRFDSLRGRRPAENEHGFGASGQFVARDGWESDSTYLFFRCGPGGALSGAHDHSDQLSFEFFANGTAWLVDPGTYTYTTDRAVRNDFRLTQAHNTMIVDELPQSLPRGPFSWKSRAAGECQTWVSSHRFVLAAGSQDGYDAPATSVKHRRSIVMFGRDDRHCPAIPPYLLVDDEIGSDSGHTYRLNFHFSPGVDVTCNGQGLTAIDQRGNALCIGLFATLARKIGTSTGHLSRAYSQREEAPVGWMKATGEGQQRFSSVIVPALLVPHGPPEINELVQGQSRTISVRWGDVQDLFIHGDATMSADSLAVRFSGRLAWIRRAGKQVLTAAIFDGNSLTIDGLLQLTALGYPKYVAADLGGTCPLVYTDDPGSIVFSFASRPKNVVINHKLETLGKTSRLAQLMAN